MDAATAAAQIGAGTASVIAVGSQFPADHLARARDRRNQKRDRLFAVIVQAAEYLYKADDGERMTGEEVETRDLHPKSIAARDPELYRGLLPQQVRVSKGITLLQVHFGHDDPLVDTYVRVAGVILGVERAWFEHLRSIDEDARMVEIPEMATALRNAQVARNDWAQEARAEVERI